MNSKVLNEHLKGVADAIREKKGTTDLINPQDFSAEIKSIEGGGGSGEGGGSNIEYFAYDANVPALITCAMFAQYLKAEVDGKVLVGPSCGAIMELTAAYNAKQIAFGIDFNDRIVSNMDGLPSSEITIRDFILVYGVTQADLDALPRITKEEFYSLD